MDMPGGTAPTRGEMFVAVMQVARALKGAAAQAEEGAAVDPRRAAAALARALRSVSRPAAQLRRALR